MATEQRLIDANEPINAFKRYAKNHPNATWNAFGIEEVINAANVVDAVEVIRCKDCKHCRVASWGERYCVRDKTVEWGDLKEDDFCSCGERRKGE